MSLGFESVLRVLIKESIKENFVLKIQVTIFINTIIIPFFDKNLLENNNNNNNNNKDKIISLKKKKTTFKVAP